MGLHVHLPDDLADQVTARASAVGTDPEQFVVGVVRSTLAQRRRLDELLAPIHEAFEASGMTEDEAIELFEAEKHAMRRGE